MSSDHSTLTLSKFRNCSGDVYRLIHLFNSRSLKILRNHFQSDILIDQDPWYEPEKSAHLLTMLPDKQLSASLAKKWDAAPSRSSANKWADIDAIAEAGGASTNMDPTKLMEAKQDIVLEYTYPRLDAEVSKKLNHLLKSPFCVHPGTGRICVPIDTRLVDEFDPLDVPTVTELLDQINTWKGNEDETNETGAEEKRVQDWEKTRLKPYVEYFRGFVNRLLKAEQNGKRGREDGAEDAMEF